MIPSVRRVVGLHPMSRGGRSGGGGIPPRELGLQIPHLLLLLWRLIIVMHITTIGRPPLRIVVVGVDPAAAPAVRARPAAHRQERRLPGYCGTRCLGRHRLQITIIIKISCTSRVIVCLLGSRPIGWCVVRSGQKGGAVRSCMLLATGIVVTTHRIDVIITVARATVRTIVVRVRVSRGGPRVGGCVHRRRKRRCPRRELLLLLIVPWRNSMNITMIHTIIMV